MKDLFPGYYRPTQDEFDDLWKRATFVFDANVLLDIHRRSEQTRRTILDTIKKLGERLWIPFEVAEEYQRNKLKVAYSLVEDCTEVLEGVEKLKASLDSRKLRDHPYLDADVLAKGLDQLIEHVKRARDASRGVSLDVPESAELASLLTGRIDEPYSGEVLNRKLEEAKLRAKSKTPPGYKDAENKRDDVRAGGDTLIWLKMVERAKETQRPIIFVTDDAKEDWWWGHQRMTYGPRPELGQEMWSVARQRFYMYKLSAFLGLTGKYLGQNVPKEVVDEVKEHEKGPVQALFAGMRVATEEMFRRREAQLAEKAERLQEERAHLTREFTLLHDKLDEDPHSSNGMDDRRRFANIEDDIDMCDAELEHTLNELDDVRSKLRILNPRGP